MPFSYLANGQFLGGVGVIDVPTQHITLSPSEERESHIPTEDECPSFLDSLNLRRLGLEQPKDVVPHLSSFATMSHLLVELDLSRNSLSDLPSELGQLASLRQLKLSSNCFSRLPSVLYTLTNLQQLDISENKLADLGQLPLAIPHLHTLRVSGNRLERLDNIDHWQEMTFLELGSERGGNLLKTLPDDLLGMLQLEELDLSNNQLHGWPSHLPMGLKHLKMTGNQLDSIPADLLHQCPDLITLDVASNLLAFLPFLHGFYMDASLRVLNVSNNNIYIVPTSVLDSDTHVILTGNPALEYHRNSTTVYAQRLRELSKMAVYSTPHNEFYMDVALIKLLSQPFDNHGQSDQASNQSNERNLRNTSEEIDDVFLDNYNINSSSGSGSGRTGQDHADSDEDHGHNQGKQLKQGDRLYAEGYRQQTQPHDCIITEKGEVWIPSLRELTMRYMMDRQQYLIKHNDQLPCTILDDLKSGHPCDVCRCLCVNEWLSAVQVKAYQTYTSVVCKVTLCSTACWLVHYQRTRFPATTTPPSPTRSEPLLFRFDAPALAYELPPLNLHEVLEPPFLTAPTRHHRPTTSTVPAPRLLSRSQRQRAMTSHLQPIFSPDSFEWIVAAATASAMQLEQDLALG